MKVERPREFRLCLLLAGALLVGAIVFGALSVVTPRFSDQPAFETAMEQVLAAPRYTNGQLLEANDAFKAVHARYGTAKWLYADIACTLMAAALGAVGVARTVGRRGSRVLVTASKRALLLLPLTVAAVCALVLASLLSAIHAATRQQVPYWADSFGLVFTDALLVLVVVIPIAAPLALWPLLLRRREPVGLFQFRTGRPVRTGLASLLYTFPMLIACALLAEAFTPGGWVKALAAVLFGWLFLNARALASAAPAAKGPN